MTRRPGSTVEWRRIARSPNVLSKILPCPDKEGDWSESKFYGSGDDDWADFRRQWAHYWPDLGGTCVEIGCGAGRLTRALAGDFERVVALDVSPDMIDRARSVVPANVEFRQVNAAEIPLPDCEADGVFSVHVLQHMESFAMASAALAESRRVLRPGGTMMVHVTLQSAPPRGVGRALLEARIRHSRWRQSRGKALTAIRMNLYRFEDILTLLEALRLHNVELRMFPVRSNGYQHHFWLATRG